MRQGCDHGGVWGLSSETARSKKYQRGKTDPDYGSRIAEGLGLDTKEVKRLAEMSQEDRAKVTQKGS